MVGGLGLSLSSSLNIPRLGRYRNPVSPPGRPPPAPSSSAGPWSSLPGRTPPPAPPYTNQGKGLVCSCIPHAGLSLERSRRSDARYCAQEQSTCWAPIPPRHRHISQWEPATRRTVHMDFFVKDANIPEPCSGVPYSPVRLSPSGRFW